MIIGWFFGRFYRNFFTLQTIFQVYKEKPAHIKLLKQLILDCNIGECGQRIELGEFCWYEREMTHVYMENNGDSREPLRGTMQFYEPYISYF
jgi:hypothetical protein